MKSMDAYKGVTNNIQCIIFCHQDILELKKDIFYDQNRL